MEKPDLLHELQKLSKKSNEEWLAGLEGRKLKELEFHNRDRNKELVTKLSEDLYEKLHGNKKYYSTVALSRSYVSNWIKQKSQGKIFLDYACGNGLNAINAAKTGAELSIGLDISDISVRNAIRIADEEGVSANTYFVQGDCENTGLPGSSIDVIICSGMLHHLDLSYAFYELRRILKPGGVILAVEALDYNPLIKMYRNKTPQMRTDWEKAHILSYKDINFASRFFEVKNIRHWHMLSILGVYIPSAANILNQIDEILMRVPLIKMMSWMFTFEMHKAVE